MDLGTDRLGFGFGGTGKKSNAKQFDDYGTAYGKNDVIGKLHFHNVMIVLFMHVLFV